MRKKKLCIDDCLNFISVPTNTTLGHPSFVFNGDGNCFAYTVDDDTLMNYITFLHKQLLLAQQYRDAKGINDFK